MPPTELTADETIAERERRQLRDQAARIRGDEALGRSRALNDLFDFLLRCSLEDRSPKEIEVRQEVFGRSIDLDVGQDASVRVYVHRLRRKLEDYYAAQGAVGSQLHIPRGEYRLRLAAPAEVEEEVPVEAPPPLPAPAAAPSPQKPRRRQWLAAGLVLLIALNVLAWALFVRERGGDPLAAARASAVWGPLAAGGRPTVIVVGDYYIFGESDTRVEISRLVREFAINSHDDLDEYLMTHPDEMGRYVDLDLSYLPVGAATALGDVLPLVRGPSLDQPVRVIPLSRLTPEVLSGSNVVYLGLLSGLGPLRDPIFAASRLKVGASYDELVDRRTGRHFVSDWANRVGGMPSSRDYGYLASVAGPNGNHIVVIAGTRDAGLMQAARSAVDPAVLATLDRAAAGGRGAEALFGVESMGNTNLSGRTLLTGALDPSAVWQNGVPKEMSVPERPPQPPAR